MNRRRFLSGCAGCAALGCLHPAFLRAGQPADNKPKVRLVFCEHPPEKPSWPHIGYDFAARRKQVVDLLTRGCPGIQFLPMRVVEGSKNQTVGRVIAGDAQVDGYIVYLLSLGWGNDMPKLCLTGKPTLLVDNLFGGSGKFLTQISHIMRSGRPVDWVSSSNSEDVVASIKHFALLGKGKRPADVAAALRAARRGRTPNKADSSCKDDVLGAPDFDKALKRLSETKIIVVGGGWGGGRFRKAAKGLLGVTFVPISFKDLAGAYRQADPEAAKAFAQRWINSAEKVVEPDRKDIDRSGAMYLAMKQLMDKHSAGGISINCLGGFYGGHLEAYPCLGFSQLNNDGFVGGCESDQMSALTMAVMGALVGRPGFISDPVIDTSKNQIIYAHCVAMTKPFGPEGASNPYRIRSHAEDRKGAAIQSLLPAGYMTTTLEIDPVSRQVLMHQGKSVGNNPSEMACRTKLEATVKGDIEKLTENWRMGWHRVTFYGDLKEQVTELSDRLKMKLIEEA